MATPRVQNELRDLSSRTVAKWSQLKQLRDEVRKAACHHAENSNHNIPPLEDTAAAADDENVSGHKRFKSDDDSTTLSRSLIIEVSDSTEQVALAPQATPQVDEPSGPAADADCADAPPRESARRVRFAAQLEEDPPAPLHAPPAFRPQAGVRGAYAARMLRAVSRSFSRALRRAPD
jgi:hypothetical protein